MSTLLIVDDDEVDRELARRSLRSLETLTLVEAHDGEEALARIALDPPDLILTDLRMPRLDGLHLVRRVHEEYAHIPTVLMTSQGSESLAVEALLAGAASYVPKSLLKENLAETISRVLDMLETRQSRRRVVAFFDHAVTRFELANDPSLIAPLAGYLEENLSRHGFADATVRTQVGMALMEAASNGMIHGNLEVGSELRRESLRAWDERIEQRRHQEPYSRRRLVCEARETPAHVEYVIEDEGPGFDVKSLPDPRAPENVLKASGRGVLLIHAFMDEVEYQKGGSRLVMRKAAASAPFKMAEGPPA